MIFRKPVKTPALMVFGALLMATAMMMVRLLKSAGRENDTTDFLVGTVFGIGLGLLILFVWRNGRRSHTLVALLLIPAALMTTSCAVAPHPTTLPIDGGTLFVDDSGAGHWLMLDKPAELNDAIDAFLRKLTR